MKNAILLLTIIVLAGSNIFIQQTHAQEDQLQTDHYFVAGYDEDQVRNYLTEKEILIGFQAGENSTLQESESPETLWTKNYGGSGIEFPGHSIHETEDGGFIHTGLTNSLSPDSTLWLIKTDAIGDTIWTKTFVSPGSNVFGTYAIPFAAGGFIVVGSSADQSWALKTDASGNLEWEESLGQGVLNGVHGTTDGGFITVGTTEDEGPGIQNIVLFKMDETFSIEWTKYFGVTDTESEGFSVQQVEDGGYIIAGMRNASGGGHDDGWLIKTDASGETEWEKAFDGAGGNDELHAVQQTDDGGFILSGHQRSPGEQDHKTWLVKTDQMGNLAWSKAFGEDYREENWSVQQTSDNGYVFSSVRFLSDEFEPGAHQLLVRKTDSSGNLAWTKTIDNAAGIAVRQTQDGGYIVSGVTLPAEDDMDIVLFRLGTDVPVSITPEHTTHLNTGYILNQNYPNPFNPSTKIRFAIPKQAHVTITVYNLIGQKVATPVNEIRSPGWHDVTFDASNLSSGVFMYRIVTGGYVETRSMMFVK